MTPGERKLKADVKRMLENRQREEQAKHYLPASPGITYWREITIGPEHVGKKTFRPIRRPLARCDNTLTDEEVVGLLRELKYHVLKRGLSVDWEKLESRHPSGMQVCCGEGQKMSEMLKTHTACEQFLLAVPRSPA
jgi:hypothetical protein